MTDFEQILTNQSAAVVVVGIFVWFLIQHGKQDEKERAKHAELIGMITDRFNRTVDNYLKEANRTQAELATKLAEFKSALEMVYVHNRNQNDEIEKYKKLICNKRVNANKIRAGATVPDADGV